MQVCYSFATAFTFGLTGDVTGPAEIGVQGVPGHTQYLLPHLVKTKFWPEK